MIPSAGWRVVNRYIKEVKLMYLRCVVVNNVGYCFIDIVTAHLNVYETFKFDYAMMLRLKSVERLKNKRPT